MERNELLTKYGIVENGSKRNYVVSLIDRPWIEDGVTPYVLIVENETIKSGSWGETIKELAFYLQSKYEKPIEELINYKTDWSKANIYSQTKFIQNVKEVSDGLYISINFTSLHSAWVIRDMLLLYGVDLTNCLLVVRKPPKAEPDEIKKFIQNEMMTKFHEYLTTSGKENDVATKIVNGVLTLNKLLDRMNTFYNNFYLIDTPTMLATYKSKLLTSLPKLTAFNEKQITTAKKYLDLYTSFYKSEKTCKKEKYIIYIKPNGEEILYK